MTSAALCRYCGALVQQSQGSIRRAIREGKPLYCDRACSSAARRVPPAQKKEAKRIYDTQRRVDKAAEISAMKAAYYQHTRDPAKERERRLTNMDRHIEYCRQPEYRAYKADYDRQLRASEYGEYGEAYLLLLDLEQEIRSRATSYERRKARGLLHVDCSTAKERTMADNKDLTAINLKNVAEK